MFMLGIIVVLVLLTFVLLICFFFYHVVCSCLPRHNTNNASQDGCFIDLEESTYTPRLFNCLGNMYWICYFNYSDIRTNKIIYLYNGKKVIYKGEETPLLEERRRNDTCCICLEQFVEKSELVELHCHHTYHNNCIRKWLLDKCMSKCPLCNHQLYSESLVLENSTERQGKVGKTLFFQRPIVKV